MKEKKTDPFYNTSAWRRARVEALGRDMGYCVWCRLAGRCARDRKGRRVPVLATMVHHVKPLRDYPELALDLRNLVSLCDRCHDEAHPEKHAGGRAQEPAPEIAKGIRIERL